MRSSDWSSDVCSSDLLEGVHVFKDARILYAPGKAANAGGVAVSGLEMSQNSARRSWTESELQQLLRDIMDGIHARRSEERRVGKECVRTCRSRWSPYP